MQKKKRLQRDFPETARREHDEHHEDDIKDFIRSELKIVNNRAGLSVMRLMPGAHKRRVHPHGLFQMGNTWVTNKGPHNQHYPQMSALAALRMPLRGENRDISHDNCSLHFKSSHCRAQHQRQGQICVLVV